jgi:hypothetical protein
MPLHVVSHSSQGKQKTRQRVFTLRHWLMNTNASLPFRGLVCGVQSGKRVTEHGTCIMKVTSRKVRKFFPQISNTQSSACARPSQQLSVPPQQKQGFLRVLLVFNGGCPSEWPMCLRQCCSNFFWSRTPRCTLSSTLYLQSSWCIIQVIYSL